MSEIVIDLGDREFRGVGGEGSESHRMLLTGAFLQDPLCHSEGLRLNGEAQAVG